MPRGAAGACQRGRQDEMNVCEYVSYLQKRVLKGVLKKLSV
jgi:hypothetical protein